VDRSHDVETDAERQRLRSLVQRLSWTSGGRAVSPRRTSPRTPTRRTIRQSRFVWRSRRESPRSSRPPFNLSRAIHRKEHLDEIERELA